MVEVGQTYPCQGTETSIAVAPDGEIYIAQTGAPGGVGTASSFDPDSGDLDLVVQPQIGTRRT